MVDSQMFTYFDANIKVEFLWQDVMKVKYGGHHGGQISYITPQSSKAMVLVQLRDRAVSFDIPGLGLPWWGWRRDLRRAFKKFAPEGVEIDL